jgi:phage repressor protein C with HTH and peptisase S24 domain
VSKIIEIFPEINAEWLLTGKGEIKKEKTYYINESPNILNDSKQEYNRTGIPLIPINAMAAFGNGDLSAFEYQCERFVVPTFKDAEFLIGVRGSSMYPKYSSGDIVACKKVPLDTFFQWNKVYVLDTEQGALIKRVKPGVDNEHILIVSDNKEYNPFELCICKIRSLAIVLGVIRLGS